MNNVDGTFHCAVHGLLSDEDMRLTLARAGMWEESIDKALESPILTWPFVQTFITIMEFIASKIGRPKCVPVQ